MFNRLRRTLEKGLIGEFVRYTIVGLLSFGVDYGTLLALNALHVDYLIAAVIAFVFGTISNYIGSTKYAFKNRTVKDKRVEWIAFIAIGAAGLLLNELFLYLLTGQAGIPLKYSKPMTQVVVFFWNFGARKALLFSERRKHAH